MRGSVDENLILGEFVIAHTHRSHIETKTFDRYQGARMISRIESAAKLDLMS